MLVEHDAEPAAADATDVPDDRLRLVFTCCHPALAPEAQVALTLRLVCGLSTAEVARAFLVPESTMAARITRAKKKIAAARIPYRVPAAGRPPGAARTRHSTSSTSSSRPATPRPSGRSCVRQDLVDGALDLGRMLHALLPADADVAGPARPMLLTDARRDTRVAADGRLVLLPTRTAPGGTRARSREGAALLPAALRRRPPDRYTVEAAIAAVHAEAPSWEATDWGRSSGCTTCSCASGPRRSSR